MDSTPVNWEALDTLVIDFAKSENLIEDSFSSAPDSPPSSPSSSSSSLSSSSYHSRLTIWKIRRSLEAGDIDIAMDLLSSHAPFILDDHRLLFRLHKQVSLVCAVFGSRENALANRKFFFLLPKLGNARGIYNLSSLNINSCLFPPNAEFWYLLLFV